MAKFKYYKKISPNTYVLSSPTKIDLSNEYTLLKSPDEDYPNRHLIQHSWMDLESGYDYVGKGDIQEGSSGYKSKQSARKDMIKIIKKEEELIDSYKKKRKEK